VKKYQENRRPAGGIFWLTL